MTVSIACWMIVVGLLLAYQSRERLRLQRMVERHEKELIELKKIGDEALRQARADAAELAVKSDGAA